MIENEGWDEDDRSGRKPLKWWQSDLLTLDNALHSLVAVAFVIMFSFPVYKGWAGSWLSWTLAGVSTIGLYLREAAQVNWNFTLRFSLHKHLEWIVGGVAGFIAAIVIEALT